MNAETGPRALVGPSVFDGHSFEHVITHQQMEEVDDLRKAFRDLEAAVYAEDRRMRSEVLPTPPEGWTWHGELSVHDVDQLSGDHMKVRLVYRLVEVA